MSVQLRVHDQKAIATRQTRQLLHLGEVVKSPTAFDPLCEALEPDGRPCQINHDTKTAEDPWCSHHLQEWKNLTARWRRTHEEAEKQNVSELETAKNKVLKLRQSAELRRQVRDRFYPRGGDMQDYIKWIVKLEASIQQLAESLLMQNLQRGPTPEASVNSSSQPHAHDLEKILKLQSPLDPKIPIGSLQGMPDDGSILVLKHFYSDICTGVIHRLYKIVPDLCDSSTQTGSPVAAEQGASDAGTEILRTWFRIMVLNNSEAPALEHATRSKTIHQFLLGCQASQLEMYCEFFEKPWRSHAVQYLRVAICAQTSSIKDNKKIYLLGGAIPSQNSGFKMTKSCWDTFYSWFPTLLTPQTLAKICSSFEDYMTLCKLLLLGLYDEHWYDPGSILGECTTGVFLGFVPTLKSDFPADDDLTTEGDSWVQRRSRNYLCGQMSVGDPLTSAFLDEIRKRQDRLYLVVYEGTNADATVHPLDPDLYILRQRSAKTREELENVRYTTMITLDDVRNELRRGETSPSDQLMVDSWQFIILDRDVGLPFELFDIVEDALLLLCGDPSPRKIAKRVVREVIPRSARETFLDDITIESSPELRYPAPLDVQYEANRYRCYDPDSSIIASNQERMMRESSRDTNRFIRRVVEDLERCGLVTLASEYERPQARPVVVQGTDGAYDLYFPYKRGVTATEGDRSQLLTLPSRTCLLDFAQSYMEKQPNALMAKGSIQTHYCAWPMPAITSTGKKGLNFVTWEGHVYHWNAMPFDRPSSANAWQFYIQHYINSKFPFVMFYLTTFVICATDIEDAEDKSVELLEEMENRGWRITLPKPSEWRSNIKDMRLEVLYEGVRPAQ